MTSKYAFYLMLLSRTENGLIFKFKKSELPWLMDRYVFCRNTGENYIKSLAKLGWLSYNSQKDILHITSQEKLAAMMGIEECTKRQVDLLLECSFKGIVYKLRGVKTELYKNAKCYAFKKQQVKNGKYKVATCLNNLPDYITHISRTEIARQINSKSSSTGSKIIKRMKHFGIVNDVKRSDILVKRNVSRLEYIHCFSQPEQKQFYLLSPEGNVFQKQTNDISFRQLYVKFYEKK